jgi:hypothetical protein
MANDDQLRGLSERILALEHENALLKSDNQWLRSDPNARGRVAELVVARLTDGELTDYDAPYDVTTGSGHRLE